MSDNKTMIRFYSILLIVTALLTYAVDLNAQYHFAALNSPLISNSFCFAILSGILTGVIVALAVEVRQYMLHKRQARNSLYAIAAELYGLISAQKARLKYYIANPSVPIPENLGGDSAQQSILMWTSQFRAIDYCPFSKKDNITLELNTFRKQFGLIERSVTNLVSLQIAHNRVQISLLEKRDMSGKVTAAAPRILNTLHKEHNALKDSLTIIDRFCTSFEKLDSINFAWSQYKKIIDDTCKKIEVDVYYNPEQA